MEKLERLRCCKLLSAVLLHVKDLTDEELETETEGGELSQEDFNLSKAATIKNATVALRLLAGWVPQEDPQPEVPPEPKLVPTNFSEFIEKGLELNAVLEQMKATTAATDQDQLFLRDIRQRIAGLQQGLSQFEETHQNDWPAEVNLQKNVMTGLGNLIHNFLQDSDHFRRSSQSQVKMARGVKKWIGLALAIPEATTEDAFASPSPQEFTCAVDLALSNLMERIASEANIRSNDDDFESLLRQIYKDIELLDPHLNEEADDEESLWSESTYSTATTARSGQTASTAFTASSSSSADPSIRSRSSMGTWMSQATRPRRSRDQVLETVDESVDMQETCKSHAPIHSAAMDGCVERLRRLVDESPDNLNCPDTIGDTPLTMAAYAGNVEAVKFLTSQEGCQINDKDVGGHSALAQASRAGHSEVVEILLKSQAVDLNSPSNDKYSCLMQAAQSGQDSVVQMLLSAAADPDLTDGTGKTALMLAASNGHSKVVELMARSPKVDREAKDEKSLTVLQQAIEEGQADVAVALVLAGADPKAENEAKQNALVAASSRGLSSVVEQLLQEADNWGSDDRSDALSQAAVKGSGSTIKLLVDKGADIDAKTSNDRTPLIWAAQEGHLEAVKLLVEMAASLDAQTKGGANALSLAAEKGHLPVVEFLFSKDADVTVATTGTALMSAIRKPSAETVKWLLDQGANFEQADKSGWTALLEASEKGQEEIVDMLLAKEHINLERRDSLGWTALMKAAHKGHLSIVEKLLQKKADPKAADHGGKTALNWVSESEHPDVVKALGLALEGPDSPIAASVTLLRAASSLPTSSFGDADIESRDDFGMTSLMTAAKDGRLERVRELLDKGADPKQQDFENYTALMRAAEGGHCDIVALFIEKAPDDDNIYSRQLSPAAFIKAAQSGHEQVVKLLGGKGAAAHATTIFEALSMAAARGKIELVRFFLDQEADVNGVGYSDKNSLMLASEHGQLAVVELLLSRAAHVTTTTSNGSTALSLALSAGHVEVAEFLIEKGADLKTALKNTTLVEATMKGHVESVRWQLEKGANPEGKDPDGRTALMWAADRGHLEVAKELVSKGATLNTRNERESGALALHLAARSDHQQVVEYLLAEGANVNDVDFMGRTALMEACCAHADGLGTVTLLLDKGAKASAIDSHSRSPLLEASERCHYRLVDMLLEKGADTLTITKALQKAVAKGDVEFATKLLSKGADLDMPDESDESKDQTPLMSAASHGHLEIVQLLLEKGAKFDAVDVEGMTACDLAGQSDHEDVVKCLADWAAQRT